MNINTTRAARRMGLAAALRFSVAGLSALAPIASDAAGNFVWLEGEQPARINIVPKPEGVGHSDFLSATNWLKISIDADQVEKNAPAEGVRVAYTFQTDSADPYEIWIRLGYEFVRSRFDWRLDDGAWTAVSPDVLTTDLMELSFWTEVAWLKLGRQTIHPGAHTIEFRLPKTRDARDKPQRILFALDAICLQPGVFHPYSHFKPGEDHQTDADRAAARHVFTLSEAAGAGVRTSLKLNGTWEVCRHDEQLPGEVAAPILDFPAEPRWTAITVPGDKNQRDDLLFAHRLWYRARVQVPASQAGRSFHLVFPQNNLNTTVFVNGQYCGFDPNPFARVQIDVSRAMKAGANEIMVGIKDAWYGRSADTNQPLKLRRTFNIPLKFFGDGFQDLAYPIWNHPQSGLLLTPELVAAGPVYAADVFCKPSVSRKELGLEVTLQNGSDRTRSGQLLCEAVHERTGRIDKAFAPQPFTIPAGRELKLALAESWAHPKLWWPDDPELYRLRTTVRLQGAVGSREKDASAAEKGEEAKDGAAPGVAVDVAETPFGFREWGSKGKDFTLNGIPWHGWADVFRASNPEEWIRFYNEKHQTTMRFWGTGWMGLSPEATLDFMDRHGVAVRRSGILDGEAIGYFAIERDPDLKKRYGSEIKMDLMRHWRDQVVAQVKGERNHPSVMLWSIENEWLYINCINLYGGLMDAFEAEVLKVSQAVQAADPTRLTMTDGGGANKDNTMRVHGNHYVWDSRMTRYPDLAYASNPEGGGRGRWVWDEKRPRFIGEDYYIAGHHPELSYLGGEAVFTGKAGTLPAAGLMARILTEGYRWAECGAFHFWMSQSDTDQSFYRSFAPRAVFCRQWDWTLGSGRAVTRTLGIFNDTHSSDPMTFTWTLNVGGRRLAGETKDYQVEPGRNEKFDIQFKLPQVQQRAEGVLLLALSVKGAEVFRDTKAVSILPPSAPVAGLGASDLLVFDPDGSTGDFLRTSGQAFTSLDNLDSLPERGRVLLVGRNALSETDSTSSQLAAWAASGRAVVVLEQRHPLHYQALPCEMEMASNEGRIAFAEDLGHPALRGLEQKDFFTWSPDSAVYRDAYFKPTRGARSLVQCDDHLRHSALVEVAAGKGVMLLSQFVLAEKLASNAVARTLCRGLLAYGASYKQEFLPVAAATREAPLLTRVLDETGLKYTAVGDAMAALDTGWIAVIAATPANLKALASHLDAVTRFTENGGWIVFNGLTPEGLADYNRVVGVEHMIRPFRREKVTFPPVKNPLTAGLTSGDVALYSSERIFSWQEGNFVASDTFSYVVDYDEVAAFARFPGQFELNLVNGMVSADAWKYIYNVPAPARPPLDIKLVFPKPQTLVEMEWIGNTFYYPVTQVRLFFDGREEDGVTFETKPDNDPQTFPIAPPLEGRELTLRLTDWEVVADRRAVTGLDNIRLKARRPPEFYERVKPMLNIGALLEYPRGRGGIVLCNVRYQESEDVPANRLRKQAILATILRNLKAPFAGKSVIVGAHLKYTPLDLSQQANAFRDEQGWFGDRRFTFKDLPAGRQTLAGVLYDIYDFPTSPVPTVLMLSDDASKPAREIRGIPVHRKADALFFLQTMRLDQRMNRDDRNKKKRFETLRYVVTYEDGETETIPVYAEIDIHDYRQKAPQALPGAQLAWSKPFPGRDDQAAAYAQQWNNPRPDVPIDHLDMLPGAQPRGVPVLLAVTAASVE
jgi:Glycosyl hydrolases family 2, sugar binding domain/Glycosyl hydrolases family 2/Glycosyl hydrolases family 2, TIM barrel domain